MIFLQYGDVLEEARSDLISAFEAHAVWNRPDQERFPELYAKRGALEGCEFWSGRVNNRDAPCNAASVAFTYCSDAVIQRLRVENVTGFGPCFKINVLADDDEETAAARSPREATKNAIFASSTYRRLHFDLSFSGGKPSRKEGGDEAADPSTISLCIPAKSDLPDMWLLDQKLVVSEMTKALLEGVVPNDVTFTRIIPVECTDGSLYSGSDLFLLTPVNNFQPFASQLSHGLSFNMTVLGRPSLRVTGPDVVIDARSVGSCGFWDGTPALSGPPSFYMSQEAFDTLQAGNVTGFGNSDVLRLAEFNFQAA